MGQTFAKEYKELITLVYYCVNVLLTFGLFFIGTIYLRRRDRKDEERHKQEDREYQERRRKEDRDYQERRDQEAQRDQERRLQEDREYQERRKQEDREYQQRRDQEVKRDQQRRSHEEREYQNRRDQENQRENLRREWCQFAERINVSYTQLSRDIPHKISKVKNTFERILIHSKVTGLDVLRYMLADDNYQKFSSKSPQLRALRDDLHMLFVPLNTCFSLLLLGEVPKNIREQIRYVVKEFGNVVKPFLTGERRRVVLECLQNFNGDMPDEETEGRVKELMQVYETVPYVDSLNLPDPNPMTQPCSSDHIGAIYDFPPDYSTCQKFSFHLEGSGMIAGNDRCHFESLEELHGILENREDMPAYVRKFKEPRLNLHDSINLGDSDKVVFTKVLHEVRIYIHYLQNNRSLTEIDRVDAKVNLDRLLQNHKEILETSMLVKIIKAMFRRYAYDLNFLADDPPDHLCNNDFLSSFEYLWAHQVAPKFQIPAQQHSVSGGENNND